MNNLRYWLWFVMAFSPGNDRIWEVLSQYEDVVSAYESVSSGMPEFLNEKELKSVKTTHIEQCDSIIEYCENKGYNIITFEDEKYPNALKNIYNPPAVLFCMGDIEILNETPCLSCVGTRRASDYSKRVTERICGELARREFTIISGFALGLDSSAHRSALAANGRTCAVLACGLDVDYPKENASAKKYIAKNGVVLTEYLPGRHPDRKCFHVRNRLIAGLGFGTLITEASETSGSLITANHAVEQGRTVFCIPPADIFDKRYAGVIKYLRDGATPVFSALDILSDYYLSGSNIKPSVGFSWPELLGDGEVPKRKCRKSSSKRKDNANTESEAGSDEWEKTLSELSEEQKIIVKCLEEKGVIGKEEIAAYVSMDLLEVCALITELEIKGLVEFTSENKFMLLKS